VSMGKRNNVRWSWSFLSLFAALQLQGCLMTGHAPSGSDMRLLYAGIVAFALGAVLWLVIRFMK
jgi:hypothetical protein